MIFYHHHYRTVIGRTGKYHRVTSMRTYYEPGNTLDTLHILALIFPAANRDRDYNLRFTKEETEVTPEKWSDFPMSYSLGLLGFGIRSMAAKLLPSPLPSVSRPQLQPRCYPVLVFLGNYAS